MRRRRRQWGARQWAVLTVLPVAVLSTLMVTAFHSGQERPRFAAAAPAKTTTSNTTAAATSSTLSTANASITQVAVSRPHRLLVVGDSLVGQAAAALRAQATPDLQISVAFRLGSAPCDWTGTPFADAMAQAQPDIVVLAFAGNAGLSAGCLNDRHAYSLAQLLGNYRDTLSQLADNASATGAAVIISTPPARNPAAPPPPSIPTASEMARPEAFYGFQGVPELRELYDEIAGASSGRWQVSDAAAQAVSPSFIYKQFLTCEAGDGACPDGFAQVRKGRSDAIHLDANGNGGRRFANALVTSALAIAG